MKQSVYLCTGGCNAQISEEKYKAGLTKCGTKDCAHFDKPFEKYFKCDDCEDCGDCCKDNDEHNCDCC